MADDGEKCDVCNDPNVEWDCDICGNKVCKNCLVSEGGQVKCGPCWQEED